MLRGISQEGEGIKSIIIKKDSLDHLKCVLNGVLDPYVSNFKITLNLTEQELIEYDKLSSFIRTESKELSKMYNLINTKFAGVKWE